MSCLCVTLGSMRASGIGPVSPRMEQGEARRMEARSQGGTWVVTHEPVRGCPEPALEGQPRRRLAFFQSWAREGLRLFGQPHVSMAEQPDENFDLSFCRVMTLPALNTRVGAVCKHSIGSLV